MSVLGANIDLREKRFVEIAREEASPMGYRRYAPIVLGPFVASIGIVLVGMVVPFYMAGRLLSTLLEHRFSR